MALIVSISLAIVSCGRSAEAQRSEAAYLRGDYGIAMEGYTPLAEKGNMNAQFYLGEIYGEAPGYIDLPQAFKWYQLAANQGHFQAQYKLGVMYYRGTGTEQNFEEALKLFRHCAEKDDAQAAFWIGNAYRLGKGVPQDTQEAIKWLVRSAERGFAGAQFTLGFMYQLGQGVQRDSLQAVKWYSMAAKQGRSDAQTNLGGLHEAGLGVPQDYEKALWWYELAAAQGYAPAQFSAARMYHRGRGAPKDLSKAAKLYEVASAGGVAGALVSLGTLYLKGEGVRWMDRTLASALFIAASKDPEFEGVGSSEMRLLSDEARRVAEELAEDLAKPEVFSTTLNTYLAMKAAVLDAQIKMQRPTVIVSAFEIEGAMRGERDAAILRQQGIRNDGYGCAVGIAAAMRRGASRCRNLKST